jgi:hypothetical protein
VPKNLSSPIGKACPFWNEMNQSIVHAGYAKTTARRMYTETERPVILISVNILFLRRFLIPIFK